jgi:hypothetical protein
MDNILYEMDKLNNGWCMDNQWTLGRVENEFGDNMEYDSTFYFRPEEHENFMTILI